MNIREKAEEFERQHLSRYAALSCASKGRKVPEERTDDIRTDFARDRDRIIHCKSFRRLKHKTQVFLAPEGDHYRERLTHTLEVSQIARTIAKALLLNEDLTEAIALGHDLGHTPFGHAGERALDRMYAKMGLSFKHSQQSVRVVSILEKDGAGLNLTWEVLDGIVNHGTNGKPSTLEGQIVRLSDKIAYINHDIDDAMRAGVLTEADIPRHLRDTLGRTMKDRLNNLIRDVILNSTDSDRINMSEDFFTGLMELREFMFEHVYKNPFVKKEEKKAEAMLESLYQFYLENYSQLPREYIEVGWRENALPGVIVGDYIAGMTDLYATKKFEELFIPDGWK